MKLRIKPIFYQEENENATILVIDRTAAALEVMVICFFGIREKNVMGKGHM
jgi:hypothetical protein